VHGDHFVNDIRRQPLTRSTRDILSGIDQLIKDGIVDSTQLAVGGYSYGGFLTNWLITQTTRFDHLFGDYPWDVSHIYQTESPIYHLNKVRTSTLIVSGEKDVRVNPAQSYMYWNGVFTI
jgi:dipeptidyl aminopeptidase/acylaminoacyl peptidase